MNPEEGRLRPQIMDRLGLRISVRGLQAKEERRAVYERVRAYRQNPTRFIIEWEEAIAEMQDEIISSREILKDTTISDEA